MGIFDGKTAFVTGGSRGIGRKMVERLASEGAVVGFNYATSTEKAEETVRAVESKGGQVFAVQKKLGTNKSIDELVAVINDELLSRTNKKGLDILINNMGGGSMVNIEETSPALFDQAISDNLRSPFLLTKELIPQLQDNGRIINVSSATVRVNFEHAAAYVCAKAGLDTFSQLLAKTLGGRGITVNSLAVGRTVGGSNDEYYSNPESVKHITDVTALRRLGTEEDIVGAVMMLVSPDAGWVTGQVIDASGGFML